MISSTDISRFMEFMALFRSDRAHLNMLTILLLLIVSIPNATPTRMTVKGLVEQSVLLPCPCSKPDKTEGVAWQVQRHTALTPVPILHYKGSTSTPEDRYKDRAKILLTESKNNCSLLLSNITPADEGTYKCSFYNPVLKYLEITLQVSASYKVSQKRVTDRDLTGSSATVKVFQCIATGRYPGQILWELDGQPLTNPSTTDSTCHSDSTGLYHLSSKLTIELNGSSQPQCVIVNPSANITESCSGEILQGDIAKNTQHDGGQQTAIVIGSCVTVGVLLLLLFSVVLYRYQRSKRDAESSGDEVIYSQLNISRTHQTTPVASI